VNIRSMDEIISGSTTRQDFSLALMTIFGSSAVLLAAIGIYGLMAHSVEQRTQEVGIRMALGAGTGAVRSTIVLQGMRLALAGRRDRSPRRARAHPSPDGLSLWRKAARPLVFASVPLFLCLTAVAAVWIPPRRASLIDPGEALRRK
jgi:putative ABC transport system permease protein